MAHEAIALWTETSSDPELIAGVRAGDGTAFGVLYERHVDAARKVAAQYTNSAADVDDVVAESFSRVLRALQRGDGPDLAFRAYLFTIVRRTGMDTVNRGNRTRPGENMQNYESALGYEAPSDEGALVGFEQGIVAEAFRSLPERWQAVLWYTEVEKKSPKDIAPLLGLTANGVAALAYRAREALRQAYLQQHLNTAESLDCLAASAQLGAYVRGGLAKREHVKVDDHVRSCEKCSALVGELEDVNRGMRGVIAPLVLGAAGVGALEGGLPIGGVFGGEAAGAAGSSGAAGGGAAGSGSASGFGAGSSFTAWASAATSVALPAAAAIGVVALVVSGASFLGVFNPLGGPQGSATNPTTEPSPGAEATPSVSPTIDPTVSPSPEPSVDPSLAPSIEPTPGAAGDDESPNGAGIGGPGDPTIEPSPDPTTDPTTEPSPDPTTEPSPDPTTGPSPDPTTEPSPDPTVDPDPDPDPPTKIPALNFRPAPLEFLEISQLSPQVSMTLSNSGEGAAADLTATIALPDGLAFAPPPAGASAMSVVPATRLAAYLAFEAEEPFAAGDWECTLDESRTTATCALAELGAATDAELDLDLEPITDATLLATDARTVFTARAGTVSATYSVRTGVAHGEDEVQVSYVASGKVAATQVGATLMGCNLTSEACRVVMLSNFTDANPGLNNNHQKMQPINSAGGSKNSASTELSKAFLPAGATVKYALLEWSASRAEGDEWSKAVDTAKLRAPGGSYEAVVADTVDVTARGSGVYYHARADITDLVAEHEDGTYSLADIALSADTRTNGFTYYGGFTITVIYEHPWLPESKVALFTGDQWISEGHPADFSFYAPESSRVALGWTAWAGERGTHGDMVRLDGDNFTPVKWPGFGWIHGNSGNAADSTAFGGAWANTLGVDAKTFVPKDNVNRGRHSILITTGADQFLIGSLTVTVTSAQ